MTPRRAHRQDGGFTVLPVAFVVAVLLVALTLFLVRAAVEGAG